MAFIAVPDTIKVALVYSTAAGEELVNTLYFEKQGGGVVFSDLGALSTSIQNWWATEMKPILSNDIALDRVELRDLTSSNSFVRTDLVQSGGDGLGAIHPLSVTKKVNFGTGFAGRSFRGGNFWPALGETDTNGNQINGAFVAQMLTSYQALLAGGSSSPPGFDWVVVSLYTNKLPRGTGLTTLINSIYVRGNDTDVIRSRVAP